MTTNQRNADVLRDGIMDLLSNEEVACISTAETAEQLVAGDEYLDLAQLDQGVRRASGAPTPMGRLLARKSVHQGTWGKILMQLTTPGGSGAFSGDSSPTLRNT